MILLETGLTCSHEASRKMLDKIFHHIPLSILSGVIVFSIIYAYIIYNVITRKSPTNSHRKEHRHKDKALVVTCASIVVIFIVCGCPIAFDILISNDASQMAIIFLVVNPVLDLLVYVCKHYYDKKTNSTLQSSNESEYMGLIISTEFTASPCN